jgi:ssDNA-binding Zn-finger/Zn-ribbon topoisomerase 1
MLITTPHTKGAGYFLNNSSGVRKQEADIRICPHCETVIMLQKWKENGSWCHKCMAPTCADGTQCAKDTEKFGCVPFIKKIEEAFEDVVKLRQHRKMVGLDESPSDFIPKIMVTM